jgi:hypothetical protein
LTSGRGVNLTVATPGMGPVDASSEQAASPDASKASPKTPRVVVPNRFMAPAASSRPTHLQDTYPPAGCGRMVHLDERGAVRRPQWRD